MSIFTLDESSIVNSQNQINSTDSIHIIARYSSTTLAQVGVRDETLTKQNKTKQNKTKQNKTKDRRLKNAKQLKRNF